MTTIYICGVESENKGTTPIDTHKLTTKLSSLKCSVVNPTEMPFAKMSWSDTLENRVELLKQSQVIYVLPNWKESIMARIELTVAMDMKKHTIFHPATNREIKKLITTLNV